MAARLTRVGLYMGGGGGGGGGGAGGRGTMRDRIAGTVT